MQRRLLMLVAVVMCLAGCDRTIDPPDAAQRRAILKEAPQLFRQTDGHVGLVGLDGIYLGQSKDAALEALADYCPETMPYEMGELGDNAWFRGCVLPGATGPFESVRVGFWPRLGDRVATLEVKRMDLRLDQARERFRQLAGKLRVDIPHSGIVEMRGQTYQMMADKDGGKDGPAHVAFGYTQPWADAHATQ